MKRSGISPGQFRSRSPRPRPVPRDEAGNIIWSSLRQRERGLERTALAVRDAAKVAQIRPQRAFPAAFTPRVRNLIHVRSGGFCEACGVPLPGGRGQCQHRVARGMGGSRNPLLGSAANGGDLCGTPDDRRTCHGRCEARDEHMHEMGWWLCSWENPLSRPVMLHGLGGGGILAWLTADGAYAYEPPGWGVA